jgi:hypothetical protein
MQSFNRTRSIGDTFDKNQFGRVVHDELITSFPFINIHSFS